MIICLEGIDASGKATQAQRLAKSLNAPVFPFPDYTTPTGRLIREHLQGAWNVARENVVEGRTYHPAADNALTLQALMLVNRMELGPRLRVAAREGHVVLDRYDASAIVYGAIDGVDPEWIASANLSLPVRPDLYVFLDVPAIESFRRRPERRDRYEADISRLEQARVGYLTLFAEKQAARARQVVNARGVIDVARWRVVDGLGTEDEVEGRIWSAVVA